MSSGTCGADSLGGLACSIKMTHHLLQLEGERQPVRADDLDHEELLELEPEGGMIRFAGRRALLLDAVAMGLLRKHLNGLIRELRKS